ncbi:MAG TPA: hypothetical protein VM537_21390, partial [Anaerolineae bacterium]|nr:hypothetical protein [Anaerolineae bacterium]
HRSAAELKARVLNTEKQIDELKIHLSEARSENREEHKMDRESDVRAHDQIVKLITARNEHCGPEDS